MITDKNIPEYVTLCAIWYRIILAEECVIFTTQGCDGIAGCYTRLAFERKAGCWYVSILNSAEDTAMVAHIIEAYEHVCHWFGRDHEFKRGEYKL